MNVNHYNNNDLLKIIGFDRDTDTDYEPSVYLINTKIDSLIVKMQQQGKLDFVSFFENIRLKLLSNNEEDDEEDEDEEDEEDEGVITTAEGDRIPGKQEDEILCEGCFLLVKESQYDMRDNVASCPHCGTQLNV